MAAVEQVSGAAPANTGKGLLRLKLGACLTGPSKRLAQDLHEVALGCLRARNRMVRTWLRYREDHPDEDGAWPTRVPHPHAAKEIGFSTYLYHAGREAAPTIDPGLVSSCAQEVLAELRARTPYNHEGRGRWKWEAVLMDEVNLPTYRRLSIPVPNCQSAICYVGEASPTVSKLSAALRARLLLAGNSSCVASFPLWAKSGGRVWPQPVVRLEARQLPGGDRRILECVARGTWKFSDSELVWVENRPESRARRRGERGTWFLHLCYGRPAVDTGLDPARVAELAPGPVNSLHPLVATFGPAHWQVGHGPLLRQVFLALDARRRAMRTHYITAGSGRRGHGRARVERPLRQVTRAVRNLVNRITAQAAAEAVRFCERYACGTLLYREPAPAAREQTWFSRNGVQWDWTLFRNKLSHQCWQAGVTLREECSIPPRAKRAAQ